MRQKLFALKTESPIQLIEAIRQIAIGGIIFPAAAQRWLMNQAKQEASVNELSRREWEVIACTAKGMTNPGIAKSGGQCEHGPFSSEEHLQQDPGDESNRSRSLVLCAQGRDVIFCHSEGAFFATEESHFMAQRSFATLTPSRCTS